ncbi:PIR Superfamily Protein [Plasmodium ovale wallikeri]|uniref:PIR Superfamily Protein n=2 Tax=Plasmodium ovale TaxID=36330 RepID=A0A1A9APA6_PLAOA|nr:PIR Superfamily Protein [Plasmodium ovale wallikeri]SBT58027.1 PIR Superfamily Protein [Plasmodium ovale wallikeri]SBT74080.1 Plasmodium vivax Vir protein, putative [Plasmodium ovale]
MTRVNTKYSYSSELPSYKFINELNKDVSNCRNCVYCDREDMDTHGDYPLKIFCYTFVRNLEIIRNKKENDINMKNMHCNHLLYWIYDKYFSVFIGNTRKNQQYIFDKLKKVISAIPEMSSGADNNPCKGYFDDIWSYNDILKKKNYNDHYVDFNYIKIELDKNEDNCFKYYDYLKKMTDMHGEMKKECKKLSPKNYCENFDYEMCNPHDLLKIEKCKSKKTIEYTRRDNTEDSASSELMYAWEHCNNLVINYSDYRAILIIGLAIWGLILTAFYLYRNTPTGLWIKNFLRKKKIIRKNFDEDMEHDMLSENSDHFHENMETGQYSVGYYPG